MRTLLVGRSFAPVATANHGIVRRSLPPAFPPVSISWFAFLLRADEYTPAGNIGPLPPIPTPNAARTRPILPQNTHRPPRHPPHT